MPAAPPTRNLSQLATRADLRRVIAHTRRAKAAAAAAAIANMQMRQAIAAAHTALDEHCLSDAIARATEAREARAAQMGQAERTFNAADAAYYMTKILISERSIISDAIVAMRANGAPSEVLADAAAAAAAGSRNVERAIRLRDYAASLATVAASDYAAREYAELHRPTR